MTRPAFAVPVADLERGEKTVTFVVPESWLRQAFEGTQAEPRGDGVLEVELLKTGRNVMIRGHAKAEIQMPCVVTLDPVPFSLEPEVFLLLTPAPEAAAGKSPGQRRRGERQQPGSPGPKKAKNRGRGGQDDLDDGAELSADDAAKDTFDGETVVLDGFLREFLLLELPLYPRRADLPSDQTPAIAPPSPALEPPGSVDPRLKPLAAIAKRLEEQNKE
jgi:uncharacterized metal-binding protein YceD (DUF177 family)